METTSNGCGHYASDYRGAYLMLTRLLSSLIGMRFESIKWIPFFFFLPHEGSCVSYKHYRKAKANLVGRRRRMDLGSTDHLVVSVEYMDDLIKALRSLKKTHPSSPHFTSRRYGLPFPFFSSEIQRLGFFLVGCSLGFVCRNKLWSFLKSNLSIGNAMSLACSHCFTSFFIKSKPFYQAEKQKEYEYLKQKIKKVVRENSLLCRVISVKRSPFSRWLLPFLGHVSIRNRFPPLWLWKEALFA